MGSKRQELIDGKSVPCLAVLHLFPSSPAMTVTLVLQRESEPSDVYASPTAMSRVVHGSAHCVQHDSPSETV